MIKINFTGQSPVSYQVDRSYNQPGITGAVQWNGIHKCFEVSNGGGWQRIDNTVEMHSNIDMHKMASWVDKIAPWVEQKLKEDEELKDLRQRYSSLDEAYKHAELIKELVKDQERSKV